LTSSSEHGAGHSSWVRFRDRHTYARHRNSATRQNYLFPPQTTSPLDCQTARPFDIQFVDNPTPAVDNPPCGRGSTAPLRGNPRPQRGSAADEHETGKPPHLAQRGQPQPQHLVVFLLTRLPHRGTISWSPD
jgi:hypothetical protein